MPPSSAVCQLVVVSTGVRIPIKDTGLLIGRSTECHVVIDDDHVSRRQAQIWQRHGDVELIPLGRTPVLVDGAPQLAAVVVRDGARLVIAGREFQIAIAPVPRAAADDAQWTLEHGAVFYGVNHAPFTLGGGDDDDVIVAGWPVASVRLHQAQGVLLVEVDADGVNVNDVATASGSVEPIGDGDRIALGALELTLRKRSSLGVTPMVATMVYPERVELQVMPRGGRLALTFAGLTRTLVVSERRLHLLVVLLQPPAPLQPGDYVADQVIQQRVWPHSDRADQTDLNVLVHRLRRDLVKAGVNGPALVGRQPGGGSTRFAVHPTTVVVVAGP